MNGVKVIAELLSETKLDDEQRRMVGIIMQSADSLIRVINDILDFSKLESSQLRVEIIPFRLEDVLNGVIQLLAAKAAEGGLALHLRRLDTPDDIARLGDPLRLRQVLLNLMGNAIKFTASGSVTLEVDASGHTTVFRIIDTGIGIAPEMIDKLFQPYQQAEASTARKYGGTGLGLSISNALLELMDGKIQVRSKLGQGTCFTVSLPLPRDPTASLAAPVGQATAATKFWSKPDRATAEGHAAVILCVEDTATNRDVLRRVLDRLGFEYDMAEDGIEALAALDRSRHGMVLTDGHMPNMHGWALAQAIREDEAKNGLGRLPLVMLTADAVSELSSRAQHPEIDGCLTKPLNRERLEAVVLDYLPVMGTLRQPMREDGSGPAPKVVAALDLTGLVDLIGEVEDDLRAVLQDFLSSAVGLQAQLASALGCGDRQAVAMAAHSLKGAAGYGGARALADAAAALEAKAKSSADMATLSEMADAVTRVLERLPEEIEESLAARFGRRG